MPIGAGRYDDVCGAARAAAGAIAAAVIILGGKHGNGFSVQVAEVPGTDEHIKLLRGLPMLLRTMANQIEADNAKMIG